MEVEQQLRHAEFAHLVRIIPCDGVVNLRFHIELVVGNIFSQLVMSKRLLQPGSYDDAVSHAQQRNGVDDAKKLKDLMTMATDIDRCIGTFNFGDFIPAFKSWDLQGLKGRFQRFRERMNSFIDVIIHERLEERKQATSYESKDFLDTFLDEADDKSNEIDLNTVRTMLWVSKQTHSQSFSLIKMLITSVNYICSPISSALNLKQEHACPCMCTSF